MPSLKKISMASALSVASLGLMASTAFAAPNIVNTGNGFTYNGNKTVTTTTTVTNTNSSATSQTSTNTSNTGGNKANKNIGGGMVMTGAAAISNMFSVIGNFNFTSIMF